MLLTSVNSSPGLQPNDQVEAALPRLYRLGGIYLGREWKHLVLPLEPISIGTEIIDKTLTTKFFPGAFALLAHVPPRLTSLVRNKRIGRLCIASGNWARYVLPIREHPTWDYVSHAIAYGRDGDDSRMSAIWRLGKNAWRNDKPSLGRVRRVDEFRRVSTNDWTLEDVRQYVDRLVGLARYMEKTKSVPYSEELSHRSGRADSNIGVAVDETGRLMHFRTGHHRIMIAKQLGISSLKVSVGIVHSRWLREAANLSTRDLVAIIRSKDKDNLLRLRTIVRDQVGQIK